MTVHCQGQSEHPKACQLAELWSDGWCPASLWAEQQQTHRQVQQVIPSQRVAQPLQMGKGHVTTGCCSALPHKLRALWAASPHGCPNHSHISIWRTALSSLRSGGRFEPFISISVQGPNTTGAAACFSGCLVSRTSCPDMELLLTAPLRLLEYA